MEFYRGVFGGELTTSTYTEGGMADDPSDADRIMHGQLAPNGMTLHGGRQPELAAEVRGLGDHDLAQRRGRERAEILEALAEGGTITMPLEKAPWGDQFGMLTDKFGVGWMVNIAGTPPQS